MKKYKTDRQVQFLMDDIQRCCIFAKNPQEALLNMFKFIYGKELWGIIQQLQGYPKVSKQTAKEIINCLRTIFPDQKHEILMMWVNNGFSVDKEMGLYFVKLTDYELRPPK